MIRWTTRVWCPFKGRVAETFSLKSSWEEGHGENSKFFIVSMKEESVRVKNGCGKLLRACFSAKVSIKEGWKGLAEVMMRRGVDGESGGADGQCGARRCSPTNREPSFVRARWHTGAPSWVVVVVGRGGHWQGPPHNLHPRPRAFSAARPATHRLFSAS